MYTRCPECETIFRVTADDLRRAQGKVRCGDCSHVFNAVEYLTEDPNKGEEQEDIPVLDEKQTDDPDSLAPANDTGIHEVPADLQDPDSTDYELEIKAYEKTGEAISALDPDAGPDEIIGGEEPLHIDLEGDALTGDDEDEIADAFATMGESATVEMRAPLDLDELPTVEMKIPDGLRDHDETDVAEQEPAAAEPDEDAWDSIPGVGAVTDEREIDIGGQAPDDDLPEDQAEAEPVNSEEKWASFFGSEPKPPDYEGAEAETDSDANADTDVVPLAEQTMAGFYPDDAGAVDEAALLPAEDEHEDPADAEQLVSEMQAAFEDTTVADDDEDEAAADADDEDEAAADAEEPDWDALEADEDSVMRTGEFAAAEVSSSRDDEPETATTDTDWQPEDWEADAEEDDHWQPQPEAHQQPPASTRTAVLSSLAIAVLAVGFIGQLVHYQRDGLAAHPAWGDGVRNTYGQLGMELYPTWPTDSYEIRGSEAVAGESGRDVLDIRGQIASISDTPVGLPQLRIVLRDRWANPVAARVFSPDEYAVGGLPADNMLQPNQTIDTHIAITDPGSGAQGFELEICLPRRDTGLECTGQGLE